MQDDNNKKAENAAAEEHRNRAVERLRETKKRNAEKQDEQAQTAKEEDRHDIRSGEMFYRKVRKTECSEKGGVSDLELRRKESKGGYQ